MASKVPLEANARTKLFTQVSRVRVEAGSLIKALDELEKATAPSAHASATAKEDLEAAVAAWEGARDTADLKDKREDLEKLLNGDDDLHGYAEDGWSALNALSRLLDRWPRGFPKDSAGWLAAAAKDSRTILQEVVYYCSRVTVPLEVEEQLAILRVGKPLDFGTAFEATLPDKTQRKQILTVLENRRIGGWVDVGAELIYKLSTNGFERVATCVAPFLLALLAAGLMYLIPTFSLPAAWNLSGDRWQLVGAFGLVIGGAVIHLLVENVKQLQSRSVPIVAITEGTYWLNLRWIGLSLTVLWSLVVAIGLRVIGLDSAGSEGAAAYLAAGYSLDSVAGLILTRFDSTASILLRNVESTVTGGGAGGAPAGGEATT